MPKGVYERAVKVCSVEGCDRKHYGNGYCQMHNRRARENGGDPNGARAYGQSCQVPGCTNRHHANGFCSKHGHRFKRHGDPLADVQERDHGPLLQRVLNRCVENPETGCWDWTGALGTNGYGQVSVGHQVLRPTHRVTYEAMVAEIPEGLVIDHLCERPICCNPYHLEPVTQRENTRRAYHGRN